MAFNLRLAFSEYRLSRRQRTIDVGQCAALCREGICVVIQQSEQGGGVQLLAGLSIEFRQPNLKIV